MNKWNCETCIHYPPSVLGGKPCCFCDISNPISYYYCEKEDDHEVS